MFLHFISAWGKKAAREKLADLCHFLYFNYQIFTEYLLRTKENIWNVMWRRHIRWTRPFFTTDAYTVTGDRGAKAQRQQDRQTHTHRKEDMTRLYLAIQPENARVRKSMIKVNWLHHRRLFWGQRTWSLSRIGRDRETRVVYKAIQTGSSKSAALGNSPRSKKKQNTCTPTAAAALFTVARTWEQPRHPSRDDWIEKMRYIHTQWNITQP